jgi:hypothetical protein
MPRPRKGESRKSYVHRAIPVLIREGRKQTQAIAIAFSMYRDKGKKKRGR